MPWNRLLGHRGAFQAMDLLQVLQLLQQRSLAGFQLCDLGFRLLRLDGWGWEKQRNIGKNDGFVIWFIWELYENHMKHLMIWWDNDMDWYGDMICVRRLRSPGAMIHGGFWWFWYVLAEYEMVNSACWNMFVWWLSVMKLWYPKASLVGH